MTIYDVSAISISICVILLLVRIVIMQLNFYRINKMSTKPIDYIVWFILGVNYCVFLLMVGLP